MKINKEELWPKTGKLKKGLIILAIVILGALAMVLVEEKTTIKFSNRMPLVIALACIGVWVYNPSKKETTGNEPK